MSVFQVEEYYVFIQIPEDKIEKVQEWINHNLPVGTTYELVNGELTVDNFDCESSAEDTDESIRDLL